MKKEYGVVHLACFGVQRGLGPRATATARARFTTKQIIVSTDAWKVTPLRENRILAPIAEMRFRLLDGIKVGHRRGWPRSGWEVVAYRRDVDAEQVQIGATV